MKNWIPLLILAGAVAGDVGDEPKNRDPLEQAREAALERDTIQHARIRSYYLFAGTPQTGTFSVVPYGEPWGTLVSLCNSDGSKRIGMGIHNGEPSIVALKDDQLAIVPVFALAGHLGIELEERPVGADPPKGDLEN